MNLQRIASKATRNAGIAIGLVLSMGLAQTATAAPESYKLDVEHLSIGFLVDHIGYAKTLGMFREATGSYTYDPETRRLADVNINIVTDSVFTNHRKRDEHLRSADFLNSREFPAMVFRAAEATVGEDGKVTIDGELELMGQTNPVTLQATLNKTAHYEIGSGPPESRPWTMGVSASGSFKRSAYGMNYAVSNGWVGDDIELIIEFEAQRQQ